MTLTQFRHTKIYDFVIPAALVFALTASGSPVFAVEFGTIKYNDAVIDYSVIDKPAVLKNAEYYFDQALNSTDEKTRQDYLQKASGEYFILTRTEPQNLYYMVQLARIYDLEDKNSYSKEYFFNALKIDKENARTNYYFGEYFYRRNEYTKALYFYNQALGHGHGENYEILIKMALAYEKLGDLLRANQYYKKAYIMNPGNGKLSGKIKELEQIKYKNTGYYKKRKE